MINNIIDSNPDKDYLKGFYFYILNNHASYSTAYDYLNYVVNFMNYNNKKVTGLLLDDYTEYITSISKLSTSYQISVYSGLKKFSTYLVDSKRTTDNPMLHISRPKYQETQETIEKREIGYLDKKEIKEYLKVAKNGAGSDRAIARQQNWKERDFLIIRMFLHTGMRCSALYKLDVCSINFDKKTLTTVEKGKKVQIFELTDDLIKCVNEWLIKREMILNNVNEDALFISNQKTRMDQSSIARVVKKYSHSIDGKHITPHKLRATYVTQLLKETKDIYFVQKAMNHSSPKVTELYIRGEREGNRKKASDIMSKVIMSQ
jgi:site-specific recombinase XerD